MVSGFARERTFSAKLQAKNRPSNIALIFQTEPLTRSLAKLLVISSGYSSACLSVGRFNFCEARKSFFVFHSVGKASSFANFGLCVGL